MTSFYSRQANRSSPVAKDMLDSLKVKHLIHGSDSLFIGSLYGRHMQDLKNWQLVKWKEKLDHMQHAILNYSCMISMVNFSTGGIAKISITQPMITVKLCSLDVP